ncbi:MAG: hypothetical protein HXY41_06345 [Chloroflexi bacterium]|nr:hypothetical protein [Chloroflexota bacterium]
MDNDTTALIVAVCGIGGVLVLLAALLVLRLLRFSIFGFASLILKMLTEPKEEGGRAFTPQILDDPSADLRKKAAALDFDAAVKKYSQAHPPPELPGEDEPPPAAPHSR